MPKSSNPLAKKQSKLSINVMLTLLVVVVAAVVIGGVLMFSGNKSSDDNAGGPIPAELLDKPNSHKVVESPDDKVKIVEFFDFQCAICESYYSLVTKDLEKEYAGKITFVTRNFPLNNHPLGIYAARAAEAADLQGKYKPMYHKLLSNAKDWANKPDGKYLKTDPNEANATFEQYAKEIGLDIEKYKKDLNSPEVEKRIKEDQDDANQIGIDGTPSFFINGEKFEPKGSSADDIKRLFRDKINEELAK